MHDGQAHAASSSSSGCSTATTTRRASRSRTRSSCPSPRIPPFRRMWIRRIHDHDGDAAGEGGLELWLRLADGVGLDREEVASCRSVLPGVRFACDAYVDARARAHAGRGGRVVAHRVLRARPHVPARAGLGEALPVGQRGHARLLPHARAARPAATRRRRSTSSSQHATTYELQERCVAALIRKTEILWHLLDCLYAAYVEPGWGPRGARAA